MAVEDYSLLIVSDEFLGFYKNGGIGTACTNLAKLLTHKGWHVTVLYTGATGNDVTGVIERYRQERISVRLLAEFADEYDLWFNLENGNRPHAVKSERIQRAVRSLTSFCRR